MHDYLPCPTDVANTALDLSKGEQKLVLPCSPSGPFVGERLLAPVQLLMWPVQLLTWPVQLLTWPVQLLTWPVQLLTWPV